MMHKPLGNRLLLRLDRGEEVIATLTNFCKDQQLGCVSLSAIGAVEATELGYYHLASFTYETRSVPEICELVSLNGNVALVDGEPFVHAHASLARRDFSLLGGHLIRATVAVTVEVFLEPDDATLIRSFDDEVRLKLIQ